MKFVLALSFLLATAQGSQESAYYPGYSDPSTIDSMYYRDAADVLQGVNNGDFSALYIKYHGCVWSEYGGNNNGGGGGGGGGDYWYAGKTQSFRANAAYSLYGVKAGKKTPSNPCGSGSNYINSMFTTGGISSLKYVGIAYANYGVSTSCTSTNNGDEQNQQAQENHNELTYPDATSTTLGCSTTGDFVQATFQGNNCNGNYFLAVDTEYEELNSDLNNLGCHQIYSSSSGDNYLSLLSYSAACSHAEYPTHCPDPHGITHKRDSKLYKYGQTQSRGAPLIMPILSTMMLLAAAAMYVMANGVRNASKRRGIEAETGETMEPTVAEKVNFALTRVVTDISQRTRSFTEKIALYAEETDDDNRFGDSTIDNDYQAPPKDTSPVSSAQYQTTPVQQTTYGMAAAAAPTADNAVSPESGKKYKRPRMAKVASFFRNRSGKGAI